jgi:hypothetical protein
MELPKPPQGINVICNSRRYDVLHFCKLVWNRYPIYHVPLLRTSLMNRSLRICGVFERENMAL